MPKEMDVLRCNGGDFLEPGQCFLIAFALIQLEQRREQHRVEGNHNVGEQDDAGLLKQLNIFRWGMFTGKFPA